MYITKNEIKAQLKDELKCPKHYITRLSRIGYIDQLKKAILAGEDRIRLDVMNDIYVDFKDYCKESEVEYCSPSYN